jgi:hypothetical protein
MDILLELDERKRASLARLEPRHSRYLASIQSDGTIVLTPAVVMSQAEAALLANTGLMTEIEDARAHPERGSQRPPRRRPKSKST